MVRMRPAPRPALRRAMMSGIINCSSFIHADVVTRTNNVPSGDTLSGIVTAAICGPTSDGQSVTTLAWATRGPSPERARYPRNASPTAVGARRCLESVIVEGLRGCLGKPYQNTRKLLSGQDLVGLDKVLAGIAMGEAHGPFTTTKVSSPPT
jgi:hypothetical protein